MARALVAAKPSVARVRSAACTIRSLVSVRWPMHSTIAKQQVLWASSRVGSVSGASDDMPSLHPGTLEEWVEAPGELWEVVAGDLGIEMVLQVIGQLEEDRGDDPAPERSGPRERCAAVAVVRKVDREERVDPAPHDHHGRVQEHRGCERPQ